MINQKTLEEYITAEANDALLYRELSKMTDNKNSAHLLNEIADDEQRHSMEFMELYTKFFRRKFTPTIMPLHIVKADFADIIADRILDESEDYRKYDRELMMQTAMPVRNVLHMASVDENVHAHRVSEILHQYIMEEHKKIKGGM